MTFANLPAFLFLLLIPPIVFLYFLKMKRREVTVSNNMFWKKALADLQVNAPFQKLRKNLLLFLQLLLLVLITLGLANPGMEALSPETQLTVVLLDGSASMKATDIEPTRFDAARGMAEDLIDSLSSSNRMALLLFHQTTELLCPPTGSKKTLRQRLLEAKPRETETSLLEALQVARSLLPDGSPGEIVLLTDGAFAPLEADAASLLGETPVRFIKVGQSSSNVGITQTAFRRAPAPGGTDQLLLTVQGFGQSEHSCSLTLLRNGSLYRAKELTLSPETPVDIVFSLAREETGIFEARLDTEDDLRLDNQAYLVLAPRREHRALLISEGNTFLERALSSQDHLNVTRIFPGSFPLGIEEEEPYDLFIHDYDGPTTPNLPAGGHLFLHASPPGDQVQFGNEVKNPVILDWNLNHPVTRFASFDDLLLGTVNPLLTSPEATPLLVTDQGPVIAAYTTPEHRAIVVGFALRDSNWPLKLSFPLVLANARSWLLRTHGKENNVAHQTSGTVPLPAPSGEEELVVISPDGQSRPLPVQADGFAYLTEPNPTGLWQIQTQENQEGMTFDSSFAVNLSSSRESDIRPLDHISIGSLDIASLGDDVTLHREFWKPLVLLALSLLLLEWYVYHRRSML